MIFFKSRFLIFCSIAVLFFSCRSQQMMILNKTLEIQLPGRKEGLKMFHYQIEIISKHHSSVLKFDYASVLNKKLTIKIFNKQGVEIESFQPNDTIILNCTLSGNDIESSKIQEQDLSLFYHQKNRNKKIIINKIQIQQTPIQL